MLREREDGEAAASDLRSAFEVLTTEISTPHGAWSLRWLTGALPPFSNGVEFVFFPRVSLSDSK